ncbi:MAG: MFS transporter [Archangium sp.]|nr:MFS transporter [Archangium sp.]
MNALNSNTERGAVRHLALLCGAVFAEFLAMGLPLPVLPGHVTTTLGFGAFVVGLAIGAQSWATLLTRHVAGTRADTRGPQSTAVLGLSISVLAGALMAASSVVTRPAVSLGVLLTARALLGLGESMVITSARSGGVGRGGRERSGLVMAWVGIAMYGALAAGAPVGTWLAAHAGLVGVGLAASAAPLIGLALVFFTRPLPALGTARLPFHSVARAIWLPGLGLTLSALGFGAIAAFSTLRFEHEGWSRASLAMTAFGVAYVAARILFGTLPDKLGGARVAMASTSLAGVGQALMFFAPSAELAIAAAALTGFGFSLSFPAFGVEAIKRVAPQNRGVALGAYAACFDLTMGVGVPALGLAVGALGFAAAFAIGAVTAALAFAIAALLFSKSAPARS